MHFGELGYAREARASYQDFVAARERGEVPKGVRFQVCLPTPFAVVSSVVVKEALAAVEAAYERAMIAEVAALCRHIPHRDLCIQWDVCNEMVIWDGQTTGAVPHAEEPREALLDPHETDFGGGAGRRRAWPAPLLRRFRRASFRRAGRCRQDGRVRQCARRIVRHKLAYIHMPVPAPSAPTNSLRR